MPKVKIIRREEVLFHIFRNLHEGVVVLDTKIKMVAANGLFCKKLGYEPDEIKNKSAGRIFKRSDIARIKKYIAQQTKRYKPVYGIEVELTAKNKNQFTGEVDLIPFKGKKFFILVLKNLKQKQDAEIISGKDIIKVINSIYDAVAVIDNKKIVFVNQEFERAFKAKAKSLILSDITELIADESKKTFSHALVSLVKNKKKSIECELSFVARKKLKVFSVGITLLQK